MDNIISLSNREMASLVWILVILGWLVSASSRRSSLVGVIKIAFQPILLKIDAAIILYSALIHYCFVKFSIWWPAPDIKLFLYWCVGVAIVVSYRTVSGGAKVIVSHLKDFFKVVVFFEFFISLPLLSFIGELLFIPFLVVLGAVYAIVERNENMENVRKIVNIILYLITGILSSFLIYKVIKDPQLILSPNSFTNIIYPIVMSLFFIPFLISLNIYCIVEKNIIELSIHLEDQKLARNLVISSLLSFNLNTNAINRWKQWIIRLRLATEAEIKAIIPEVKEALRIERSGFPVESSNGWSPRKAIRIFEETNLRPRGYDKIYENEWYGSSNGLELSSDVFADRVVYSISGKKGVVQSLNLTLYANGSTLNKNSENIFYEKIAVLLNNALVKPIDLDLSIELKGGEAFEVIIERKLLKLVFNVYENSNPKQFELKFSLSST